MSKSVWSSGAAGVRGIAIVEATKGLLVLLVGFGLLSLAHRDVEQFAAEPVRHAHLNPASHYPHIFIETATAEILIEGQSPSMPRLDDYAGL